MKILLVDRDFEEMKGIEWYLKSYLSSQIELHFETSVISLQQVIHTQKPDLIIVETDMLTKAAQLLLKKLTVPIIALTSQPIFQQAVTAINLGAIKLFTKPIHLEDLKSLIMQLPSKNALSSPNHSNKQDAQLYLDLYLQSAEVIDSTKNGFFLIEPEHNQNILTLYNWLQQSPIFEDFTALPLQKRIICIAKNIKLTSLEKSLRLIIGEWEKYWEQQLNISYYEGEVATVRNMYEACKNTLAMRFYKGYGQVFSSASSLVISRLDPLLTPEQQQLFINSLENNNLPLIKEFLYRLTANNFYYHHEDVRIHLTSILAQIRRFMLKYQLHQIEKFEEQYRALFHLILEHPTLYHIVQEIILFTQLLTHNANISRQQMQIDYVELAVSIIEKDYTNSLLSLSDVANQLNISSNYLSNIFSKKRGIPFKRYLKTYRIQKAESMLRQSDLPIVEIAEAVGFVDSNYFIKVFKEIHHTTPYRYRHSSKKLINHKFSGDSIRK